MAWCAFLVAEVDAAAPPTTGYPIDGFCAQVTDLLGVPPNGSGVLDALTLVYGDVADKVQADAATSAFTRFDEFAQKLLAGSEPRLLETRVLDLIDVASGDQAEKPPAWRFGSHGQRLFFGQRMWHEAKRVRPTDPARAARLGKAAILLQVQDLFSGGPGLLRDPACPSLVSVDAKQIQPLLDQFSMPYRDAHAAFGRIAAIVQPLERCIAGGKPQEEYQKDAADVIKAFHDAWPQLTSRHDCWQFAHLLWQFVCLSRDRHDQSSIDRAQAVVSELAPATVDPYAKPWLEQAMTMPGERPKTTSIRILTEPNQMKPAR